MELGNGHISEMMRRIHIMGASGSGTTTLGRAVAERLGYSHFDADSYIWFPSDPPFEYMREGKDRLAMLTADIEGVGEWVLSGAVCGWGDPVIPLFDFVVFLTVPTEVRLERLERRELARYGPENIEGGGHLHKKMHGFLKWAAAYDVEDTPIRSRREHERWLSALPCPVLRLEGDEPVDRNVDIVVEAVQSCQNDS